MPRARRGDGTCPAVRTGGSWCRNLTHVLTVTCMMAKMPKKYIHLQDLCTVHTNVYALTKWLHLCAYPDRLRTWFCVNELILSCDELVTPPGCHSALALRQLGGAPADLRDPGFQDREGIEDGWMDGWTSVDRLSDRTPLLVQVEAARQVLL